jgi:hypothetical protein
VILQHRHGLIDVLAHTSDFLSYFDTPNLATTAQQWSSLIGQSHARRVELFLTATSKYEQSDAFGVVATATSNIVWTPEQATQPGSNRTAGAGRAYAAANEEVLCWDVKKGELLSRWRD